MMKDLSAVQLKALSDFGNTVAAAWFFTGVIAPFFTRSKTLIEGLVFPISGLLMAWFALYLSLLLLEGVEK